MKKGRNKTSKSVKKQQIVNEEQHNNFTQGYSRPIQTPENLVSKPFINNQPSFAPISIPDDIITMTRQEFCDRIRMERNQSMRTGMYLGGAAAIFGFLLGQMIMKRNRF